MPDHPYGWLSLLPPLVAIVLAIATRRVILPLFIGVTVGALILQEWQAGGSIAAFVGHLLHALGQLAEEHLWKSLTDEDHLRVFAFTLLMGAMVGVIYRSGGMHGVVDVLGPLARTRRGGQLVTWLLGLLVFFDDYANTLLLGPTMRPLTDKLRISREKLAYLVDSTAAPVAGLAIVSTWVATEIGFINEGLVGLEFAGPSTDGFNLFIASIPYRFYVLLTLLFIPLVALLGRDFGPMLAAERKAANMLEPLDTTATSAPKIDVPHRWYNAVVPVLMAIFTLVVLLLVTGREAVRANSELEPTWFNIFSKGDSYLALLYGSLAGLGTVVLLTWTQRILKLDEIGAAAFEGAKHMLLALTILWLAWSLSAMTDGEPGHLNTGGYVGDLIRQSVAVHWMPTIVFVVAAGVAFATGTSWGTMAILMPLVINVTYHMLASRGGGVGSSDPLLVASIGSVLAGAIFGDHCSPISDTTILSSQASGCNHVAHVWTQLPYAMLVAAIAIVCGTLPAGMGVSPWLLLPLGVVAMFVSLLLLGRRV
jgi:Na+/H+ antiporter NhaC